MIDKWAFIDSYGNDDIAVPKAGATNYFITVAIVCTGSDLSNVRLRTREISSKYFDSAPIKSNRVSKLSRRVEILNEIVRLPIKYYAFILEKRLLNSDTGLRFQDVFHKHLTNRVVERLWYDHPYLTIRVDRLKDKKFCEEIKKFILKKHDDGELFDFNEGVPIFDFDDDLTEPMLQLADFIAGSLAKVCEAPENSVFRTVLSPIELKVDKMLRRPRLATGTLVPELPPGIDDTIYDCCAKRASDFVVIHDNSRVDEVRAQVEVLRHLLYLANFDDFVSANEVLENLKNAGFTYSRRTLRSDLIGKLRDAGVIIASSTNGYKIPSCLEDIQVFLRYMNDLVTPMLKRVKIAKDEVKQATGGVDVIDVSTDLHHLNDLIKALPII